MLEDWNDGRLECWKIGMLEDWNDVVGHHGNGINDVGTGLVPVLNDVVESGIGG